MVLFLLHLDDVFTPNCFLEMCKIHILWDAFNIKIKDTFGLWLYKAISTKVLHALSVETILLHHSSLIGGLIESRSVEI